LAYDGLRTGQTCEPRNADGAPGKTKAPFGKRLASVEGSALDVFRPQGLGNIADRLIPYPARDGINPSVAFHIDIHHYLVTQLVRNGAAEQMAGPEHPIRRGTDICQRTSERRTTHKRIPAENRPTAAIAEMVIAQARVSLVS
jgi:hypothetical protein